MEQIKLAINTKDTLALHFLENLQGTLKTLSEENYEKLKTEILKDGFSFAVHVYEDIPSGKIYIIDGHQRVECLRRMKEDGFQIPQVPVVFIQADNLDHAKRKVLAAASQYGSFNQKGAEDFIKTIEGIDLEYLKESFSMPFINFDMMDFTDPDKILVNAHLREKTDPNKEWEGMPEFNQENKQAFRSLIVHFKSQEDLDAFSELTGQGITDKTKSMWYPPQINMDTESKRYADSEV